MDTKNKAVVVLAAGMGSRLSGIGKTNKCAVDLGMTTPLRHTIKSFADNGVKSFVVVVGYEKDSVVKSIDKLDGVCVTFVENPHYNFHGCEYSLSCAHKVMRKFDEIFITEGDLLIEKSNLRLMIDAVGQSAVLLRDKANIDKHRSVVALGNNGLITEFVYDSNHNDIFDMIADTCSIIGESGQVWRFGGKSLSALLERLQCYHESCDLSEKRMETGIYSINSTIACYPMTPVFMQNNNWLNINTYDDVLKGRSVGWLQRY